MTEGSRTPGEGAPGERGTSERGRSERAQDGRGPDGRGLTRDTGHVALLGDSILDNGAYVPGGPDVTAQVRSELPPGWDVTLLALDGDVINGISRQLRSVPHDATHLVISVGGNDALGHASLLTREVSTVADAMLLLGAAQDAFRADYEAMLASARRHGLPTAVCTIYDTPPSEPGQPVIRTALSVFNDCITRAAFTQGVTLVDLRVLCTEDADYANPIEPSAHGGAKIAKAIAAFALPDRDVVRSDVVGPIAPVL